MEATTVGVGGYGALGDMGGNKHAWALGLRGRACRGLGAVSDVVAAGILSISLDMLEFICVTTCCLPRAFLLSESLYEAYADCISEVFWIVLARPRVGVATFSDSTT
eukprot:GFYU01029726.1.p1 GENE.GFYU01029726.1~~GFYU01029726.1.p1  ORF type:complete len:107 (-),score=14.63 GFYU01029726.1:7-327(-)